MLDGDVKNFKLVDINKLIKAPWNYKEEDAEQQEKLENSIKKWGQVENIIVRDLGNGTFEVANGNHRIEAFKKLNFKKVFVYDLGRISMEEAALLATSTNENKFKFSEAKLSELLKTVSAKVSIQDMVDVLPWDETMVNDYIKVSDFDFAQFEKATPSSMISNTKIDYKTESMEHEVSVKDLDSESKTQYSPVKGENEQYQYLKLPVDSYISFEAQLKRINIALQKAGFIEKEVINEASYTLAIATVTQIIAEKSDKDLENVVL